MAAFAFMQVGTWRDFAKGNKNKKVRETCSVIELPELHVDMLWFLFECGCAFRAKISTWVV